MTLDAGEWPLVKQAWGSAWSLIPNGSGKSYVSACRSHLCALADQQGSGNTARLARLLMGARRGETVVFRDRDPLNLTRGNLALLDKAAAARWLVGQPFQAILH